MVLIKRRKARTVSRVKYQTGKTVRTRDVKRKAKYPGKRISKTGRTYWETRRNRSDRSKRKKL